MQPSSHISDGRPPGSHHELPCDAKCVFHRRGGFGRAPWIGGIFLSFMSCVSLCEMNDSVLPVFAGSLDLTSLRILFFINSFRVLNTDLVFIVLIYS